MSRPKRKNASKLWRLADREINLGEAFYEWHSLKDCLHLEDVQLAKLLIQWYYKTKDLWPDLKVTWVPKEQQQPYQQNTTPVPEDVRPAVIGVDPSPAETVVENKEERSFTTANPEDITPTQDNVDPSPANFVVEVKEERLIVEMNTDFDTGQSDHADSPDPDHAGSPDPDHAEWPEAEDENRSQPENEPISQPQIKQEPGQEMETESSAQVTQKQPKRKTTEEGIETNSSHVYLDLDQDQESSQHIGTFQERFETYSSRFPDDEQLNQLNNDGKSKNTIKSTKWAVSVFEAWRVTRQGQGHDVPSLEGMHADEMNQHLSHFVVEVRKQDGSKYPPNSLHQLMTGLVRHLRDTGIDDLNFLNQSDARFAYLRSVLGAEMKQLTKEGLTVKHRSALPVSEVNETQLWDSGIFGSTNAKTLQHTVFFYNCKLFGLHGCEEHRELTTEQFAFGSDENGQYIDFKGKISKRNLGGLKHQRLEATHVRQYDDSRGIVDIFRLYIEKVGEGSFYKRPLDGESIRFGDQDVGINKMRRIMKEMCALVDDERK